MALPSRRMSPREIGFSPAMARRSVDFPLPFAPTMATMRPASSSSETSCTAGTRPWQIWTSRTWSMVPVPQVRLDDRRVRRHRDGRALGDLPAAVEDEDAVRERHDPLHHVLDDDAGDPEAADAAHEVHGLLHLGGREPGHDLVEEEEAGPRGERARHLEPLLLGDREERG